ncbi:hypothetical protein AB0C59_09950 [Streptomyces sp. NPDC048664]|uniref:hypothetical protein n=1 Tax=Streptomyces sp. NPDC048664 TaxID=3154505 RepID=UPI003417F041
MNAERPARRPGGQPEPAADTPRSVAIRTKPRTRGWRPDRGQATTRSVGEHGFRPEASRWVIGGLEHPAPPFDFIPHPHPADVDVSAAPEKATLDAMLDRGEIDALFSANAPSSFLARSPNVARLFPDHESLERDHHRRTGIFPIMHTVVVRQDLLKEDPGLVREVYRTFLRANGTAADRYRRNRRLYQVQTMLPWTNALVERVEEEFPEDWWPYGIAANRATLYTCLRYHHEQGLSPRRWRIEDVFAPDLLDT